MDKSTFETGFNTHLYYVTHCKGMAMESWYLKLIFKSRRTSVGIWGTIILGLKGLVHFWEKERSMNSDIYINQVLKRLRLLLYNQYIEKNDSIIWIDDSTGYHTSKMTTTSCYHVGLTCIDWPVQSSDLNPIENL